jgi:hypothetical protein
LYLSHVSEGRITVFGNGTPKVSASELLHLSSAPKRLFTLVPVKAAFLDTQVVKGTSYRILIITAYSIFFYSEQLCHCETASAIIPFSF